MYHVVTYVKFPLQQVVRRSKPIGLYQSHSLPTYLDPRTGEPTYDSHRSLLKTEKNTIAIYRLREPKSIPSSVDQESESSQKEASISELSSS